MEPFAQEKTQETKTELSSKKMRDALIRLSYSTSVRLAGPITKGRQMIHHFRSAATLVLMYRNNTVTLPNVTRFNRQIPIIFILLSYIMCPI